MANLQFFDSLTKGTKQALPFLTSAAAGNQSPSEILQSARNAGLAFRTQQALDVIGLLRDNVNLARSIRTTPADQPLDPSKYGTSIGPLLKNYSYEVQRTIVTPSTGETTIGYVTVTSNDPLSQEEILATAESFGSDTYTANGQPSVIEDMRVTNAVTSPGI